MAFELQREGLGVEPDRIRSIVEEHHFAVEPWPFEPSPSTDGYMVSEKETSPSPRSTFLSSLPLALRGSLSSVSST